MRKLKRHAACDIFNGIYKDIQTHNTGTIALFFIPLDSAKQYISFCSKNKGFRKTALRSLHKL
jgi:hypothetical protein